MDGMPSTGSDRTRFIITQDSEIEVQSSMVIPFITSIAAHTLRDIGILANAHPEPSPPP
jgi:hypothetical protein